MADTAEGRNLLCPVLDSEDCQRCLDWVLEHVHRLGDTIHLLHIVENTPGSIFFKGAENQQELRVEQARAFMSERFVARCEQAKAQSHVTILQQSSTDESVGEMICVRAEALRAAVIAMPPHNRGRLVRFIQGSAAQHCLRQAPVTVLIAQLAPAVNLYRQTMG